MVGSSFPHCLYVPMQSYPVRIKRLSEPKGAHSSLNVPEYGIPHFFLCNRGSELYDEKSDKNHTLGGYQSQNVLKSVSIIGKGYKSSQTVPEFANKRG